MKKEIAIAKIRMVAGSIVVSIPKRLLDVANIKASDHVLIVASKDKIEIIGDLLRKIVEEK